MENWKGTKGECFEVMPARHVGCTIVSLGDFQGDIEFWHHQESKEIAEENAKLVSDALITVNECGLLPSELLEHRNELLTNLKHATEALKAVSSFGATKPIIERFQELINKISK